LIEKNKERRDVLYAAIRALNGGLPKQASTCWGPSASEGPQKQDLTVFLEYNV
jgi:hypothetical protein